MEEGKDGGARMRTAQPRACVAELKIEHCGIKTGRGVSPVLQADSQGVGG
jgi:hypothetical protein